MTDASLLLIVAGIQPYSDHSLLFPKYRWSKGQASSLSPLELAAT